MSETQKKGISVWVAIFISLVIVLIIGATAFYTVREQPRDFDYGTVPFVPGKSHYSIHPVESPDAQASEEAR